MLRTLLQRLRFVFPGIKGFHSLAERSEIKIFPSIKCCTLNHFTLALGLDSSHSNVALSFWVTLTSAKGLLILTGSSGKEKKIPVNGVTQALMGRQSLAAVINKILLVWALYHCSVDSDATIILLEGNITVLYIPGSYKENVLPS